MAAADVATWAFNRMKKEFNRRKLELCDNTDKVYVKLKKAGAALPATSKWNGLSCDQKLAFMIALGPMGLQMVIAGTRLGGFATNAVKEMSKYADSAASKIGDAGASWAKSATSSVTKIFKSPF